MNNTAISRNFIRTPAILTGGLFASSWAFVVGIGGEGHLAKSVLLGVVSCYPLGFVTYNLGKELVRKRLKNWASWYHGVHPDDLDDFLARTSPEDLEKMVAHDFEGLIEDEDEEEFFSTIDESK